MAEVALGRRLFKGRERANVKRLLYYARLVKNQELRASERFQDAKTDTPAIGFDTVVNPKIDQLEAVITRCMKMLTWICRGHGIPAPNEDGNIV